MAKVLKNLRGSGWAILAIVALLIIQATCDLSLPEYTSRIVDVGIQQGGIDEVAPDVMRVETYDKLSRLMTEAERQTVSAAYAPDADGNLALARKDRETLDALNEILCLPMVIVAQMEERASGQVAGGEGQKAESPQGSFAEGLDPVALMRIAAGTASDEQILALRSSVMGQVGEDNASLIRQRALLFVKAEYEAVGMDLAALQTSYLLITGAKMMGVTLGMVAAAILVGLLAARLGAKLGMVLREKVFQKVVSFSNGDIDRFSTASLITRSTNDIQQVQMTSVMLMRMIVYAPILGIGGVIKVSSTRTGMGWIIFVAVLGLLALVGALMSVAMPKFKKMQTLLDRINLVAREILTGILVIRAFSREDKENERFAEANTNLMRTQLFTNRLMSVMMPMMMLILNCITLAIVWFGAKGADLGNLQVGDLMAFITYTMQIVMSFLMLAMASVMLPRAVVAAGRINEVLETKPSIADPERPEDARMASAQGVVTFEDISFRYPDAEQNVLEHISFTARPGETTAIIGGTGSGKSTLLNLIPRFFDVTQGRVLMDGVDIRSISQHSLRSLLGYVPQKGVLFSGTIESNLRYGGESVTDDDIREAAAIAQADAFIAEKAEGMQASIAQGGTNVSGGQKQRLSIARAIAKKPKVLLFDDSFSALDYKTDVALRRALHAKVGGATVIIVAQRISTVLHADQIVVLEEGRMVGLGTHEELMRSCKEYQEIARSQLSEEELKGGKGA